MTVEYNATVATARFCGFLRLLLRWKGSIYKLLWVDTIVYFVMFILVAVIYRYALTNPEHKRVFESISEYCDKFSDGIPLSFVLGFYVSSVYGRWCDNWNAIPWPARLSVFVTANIHGQDEVARLYRRTIVRYVSLGYTMTMVAISPSVKRRFPTLSHITDAGIMLPNEEKVLENLQTQYCKYYIPFIWASTLVVRARRHGYIKDDFAVLTILDELNAFRGKLQMLLNYDWVTIPLVYTQVCTIAVYIYFTAGLLGRQALEQSPGGGHGGDLEFPLFTFLEFLFYSGWLKVAEQLLNPFGDDDDDFEINRIIDGNLRTSYLIVDDMHISEKPELVKDQYWDMVEFEIPYTEAAIQYQKDPVLGSAVDVDVPEHKQQFVSQKPSKLFTINEELAAGAGPVGAAPSLASLGLKSLDGKSSGKVDKTAGLQKPLKTTASADSAAPDDAPPKKDANEKVIK